LFHLNSKTSGKAHSIVSRSPLSKDGFRSAYGGVVAGEQSPENSVQCAIRTFQGCLPFLQFSGLNIEDWEPILVYMCSTKLPKLMLSLWEQSIQNKAEISTWLQLHSFLTERHRTFEAVDSVRSANFLHVQSKNTSRVAEFPKINFFNIRFPMAAICVQKRTTPCVYVHAS